MGLQLPKFNMPKMPSIPGIAKAGDSKQDLGLGAGPSAPKPPIAKILMVLVPVGALAVSGAMVMMLGQQVSRLKQEISSQQMKAEELAVLNRELNGQLSAMSRERSDADEQVNALQEQLAEATKDLESAKVELETLQWRFERVSENKTNLETEVTRLTQENSERQARLAQLSDEKQELEETSVRLRERLNFIDRDYQSLAKKVKELELEKAKQPYDLAARSVEVQAMPSYSRSGTPTAGMQAAAGPTLELPPIIVRKDQAATAAPVRGRLVEVNQPHRFVVVDKGSADGVRMGMSFDVVRGSGGQTVARATVVRVRPQLAACDFVGAEGDAPQVGDVVVQRNR